MIGIGDGGRERAWRVLGGFGVFGVFWGAWGAAMPAVQARAHIGEAAFGAALLLIGTGALASMRLTGLLLDRFGRRVAPVVVLAFAACALAAGSAASPLTLGGALLALGACSGAFDVVINTAAVRYEAASGRPLLGAAHAAFSAAVVVTSALTGIARSSGAGPPMIFAVVAALLCAAVVASARPATAPAPDPPGSPVSASPVSDPPGRVAGRTTKRRWRASKQVVLFGGMCALANLVENAQQSWSARQLEVVLDAPPHVSGLGPAVFALATVTARLASQALAHRRVPPRLTLLSGALLAAGGTALMAAAPGAGLCLAGVAIAGLGTGVCAPTIISAAGAGVAPGQRGATISTVMTIAYLGFAAGPAYVGLIADRVGLRTALGAVAGVAVLLALTVAVMPRRASPDEASPQLGGAVKHR